MKTSDIPHLRSTMVTTDPAAKSADKSAKSDADAKPARRGDLQSAGQSGDQSVQKLLAERQAHESNANEEADPALVEQRKVANEAIAAIDEKLADLGYSAK